MIYKNSIKNLFKNEIFFNQIYLVYDIGIHWNEEWTNLFFLIKIFFTRFKICKDGNGVVEKKELSAIVNSIYQLLSDGKDSDYLKVIATEHSKEIFKKFDIDENNYITVDEFVDGCMNDKNLLQLLAPSAI